MAEALNRDFVSIKVDREERPDVDDIYMKAVQMMTGSRRLAALAVSDAGPPSRSTAGTYFPPDSAGGRPGFLQVLRLDRDAWKNRRAELESSAGRHARAPVGAARRPRPRRRTVGPRILETARSRRWPASSTPSKAASAARRSFRPAMRLEFLIRRWVARASPGARTWSSTTLEKMAAGRDLRPRRRRVSPLLGRCPVARAALREDALRQRAARARLPAGLPRVRRRRLRARGARDARLPPARDDPGRRRLLRARRTPIPKARRARSTCGIRPPSRRPSGRTLRRSSRRASASRRKATSSTAQTVLSVVRSVAELAAELRPDRAARSPGSSTRRGRRCTRRASKRVWPRTDEKLLTDWSALAISAFALAGRVLDEPRYEAAARARGRPDPARTPSGRRAPPPREGRRRPASRGSPATTPTSSRRSSTSTRRPSSPGTSPKPCGSRGYSTSASRIRAAATSSPTPPTTA